MGRIIGYRASELINQPVLNIMHPDYREAARADVQRIRDRETDSYIAERQYLRKDGTTVWIRASVGALRHGDGSIDCLVGVIQDISGRKRAEELLRRQADLLNQSHDAILTMHPGSRRIVYWNRGAEKLYGYTAAEAEGRRCHELLRTRGPISVRDIDTEVIDRGTWRGELTHTTRNGRELVVESHIVRVCYDDETFALETNRDITERKRAEEHVRLLMREMDHRGKNMLSLVQVIARQTASGAPEQFVERFAERVQALAANQDLLVKSQWRGADLEALVRIQLAPFADLIGSRIIMHGPRTRLNAAAAQAVGLAVHELATNASKYGALSNDGGRVDVDWQSDGRRFAIKWAEHDGPPVAPPARRGFGSTVVESMTKHAVDGEVELDYAPSGFEWHLSCPAANALEAVAEASHGGRNTVSETFAGVEKTAMHPRS